MGLFILMLYVYSRNQVRADARYLQHLQVSHAKFVILKSQTIELLVFSRGDVYFLLSRKGEVFKHNK